ncbi:chemotaxis protein CheW [Vibrio cincinnatiensis]|jgi:purine-binding chemotaxis protein CheW|uniref:Purine-binding chemotaxis protein CheW n=1 Tax=Vibrio cincinnatiensis DSM 19608 TaxID=1123491 RepID=A0A1T4MBA7_VIBCI|nr:chemotaxis protein CheW [Vibrio cincinnatiensis]MCG3725462.1 chemotaxis protein CheW [Vibrio cincinnatiensis]MCG3737173.1 chemotaxis protein CheW [Vibrio cincinnatiensis]MCG3746362.1 chemotaxis protein CheW [Vibrio cincinnatiensis]MCG3765741.1 chemotaxis protein CheW [Vibrio cincinnatiensis]SJZ64136.1 purine-binding chemotaxis protein CheW [Vibrio cincinnatiensis DSM 19608]
MSSPLLSSEQALEDYFTALLEDEFDESEWQVAPVSREADFPLEPQLAPAFQVESEVSHTDQTLAEFELPNLDDVQRLLSQLENRNPVDEVGIEAILEQNTQQIAQSVQTSFVVEAEEIQEWDVEPYQEVPLPNITETVEDEVAVSQTDIVEEVSLQTEETISTPEVQVEASGIGQWDCPIRETKFQVLYFEVNGVTFAVPLDELGGIHRKMALNHLIGRPPWYLGLQTSREHQLDVVDTAKWVMAEKLRDDSYKEEYQYIVMLDESMWGLACTKLLGTEWLSGDKVRWREQVGKRPWLAGMVKEKMCALIHVQALIAMLNAGLDVKALDK